MNFGVAFDETGQSPFVNLRHGNNQDPALSREFLIGSQLANLTARRTADNKLSGRALPCHAISSAVP